MARQSDGGGSTKTSFGESSKSMVLTVAVDPTTDDIVVGGYIWGTAIVAVGCPISRAADQRS